MTFNIIIVMDISSVLDACQLALQVFAGRHDAIEIMVVLKYGVVCKFYQIFKIRYNFLSLFTDKW